MAEILQFIRPEVKQEALPDPFLPGDVVRLAIDKSRYMLVMCYDHLRDVDGTVKCTWVKAAGIRSSQWFYPESLELILRP